jgi:hypothetical protein
MVAATNHADGARSIATVQHTTVTPVEYGGLGGPYLRPYIRSGGYTATIAWSSVGPTIPLNSELSCNALDCPSRPCAVV